MIDHEAKDLDRLVNRAVAEVKAQRRARAWDKYNALPVSI